jgi:hypothetical protein
MAARAKRPQHFVVVLKLPEYEVPLLLVRARAIREAMTGNQWFSSPLPDLTLVEAAIDELDLAEVAAASGTKGLVAARDERKRSLVALLQQLAMYVQAIATANPEHAASIVESACMYLKVLRGPGPSVFRAIRLSSGALKVIAPSAGDRAAYEFQYSLDGGVTWLPFPQVTNTKCSDTLHGLPPGSMVHLRYRATVKGVTGNLSDPIAIIVD